MHVHAKLQLRAIHRHICYVYNILYVCVCVLGGGGGGGGSEIIPPYLQVVQELQRFLFLPATDRQTLQ